MPQIYRNFANAFDGLNDRLSDEFAVAAPGGGRAYLRAPLAASQGNDSAPRIYLDQVHLQICDEFWWRHHDYRDRFTANKAMQGRVYAGCAGVVNLEYISATRAPAALLYDINPLQRLFWQGFFKVLAETPDNKEFAAKMPAFQKALYYQIEKLYGRETLKRLMRPPVADKGDRWSGGPEAESPFRRIRYDQMGRWMEHQLSGYEAEKTWLGDPAKYRHLHLMAKFNAVAFVTLDVRDRAACHDIARALEDAAYFPGRYQEGSMSVAFERAATKGAKIGLLYRSNVCHYLKWSKKEINKAVAEGHEPRDFSGRPVTVSTYRKVREQMRSWLDPQGATLVASDCHSGGHWGQFIPSIRQVTGKLLPS